MIYGWADMVMWLWLGQNLSESDEEALNFAFFVKQPVLDTSLDLAVFHCFGINIAKSHCLH